MPRSEAQSRFSFQAPEGTNPTDPMIPDFQAPGHERINFCCLGRPVCGALQRQPQNMTQTHPWPPRWASNADGVRPAHHVNPHPRPQPTLCNKTKLLRSAAPSAEQTAPAWPPGHCPFQPHSILQVWLPDLIMNVLFILLWVLSGELTSWTRQETQCPRVAITLDKCPDQPL